MVFGDYYIIDENENIIEHFQRHNFNKDVSLLDQPAHGACTMFKVECLKQLGGYDETISRQDGYELWPKFISILTTYRFIIATKLLQTLHFKHGTSSVCWLVQKTYIFIEIVSLKMFYNIFILINYIVIPKNHTNVRIFIKL